MKKPQTNTKDTKDKTQSKQVTKKEELKEDRLALIIDSEDVYGEDPSVFYIHPKRLFTAKYLTDKIFDEVVIKNSLVDGLTSMNFNYILRKMKVNAPITVIVSQPLSVMQSFDAKQIEANLNLAGFTNIKIEDYEYTDEKTNLKVKTLVVVGDKPEKDPNKVEVELTATTKTTTKGNTVVSTDKKITAKVK